MAGTNTIKVIISEILQMNEQIKGDWEILQGYPGHVALLANN